MLRHGKSLRVNYGHIVLLKRHKGKRNVARHGKAFTLVEDDYDILEMRRMQTKTLARLLYLTLCLHHSHSHPLSGPLTTNNHPGNKTIHDRPTLGISTNLNSTCHADEALLDRPSLTRVQPACAHVRCPSADESGHEYCRSRGCDFCMVSLTYAEDRYECDGDQFSAVEELPQTD